MKMQQSGGLLPATAGRSRTLVFANGKNANKSLLLPVGKSITLGLQAAGL